ncbi:MAG: hypothetical protein WA947_13235 [Phormidesmis sp.]
MATSDKKRSVAVSPEHYDWQNWTALPTIQSILGSRLGHNEQWRKSLQLSLSVRRLSAGEDVLAYAKAPFKIGHTYDIARSDWNNARLYYREALRSYRPLDNLSGIAEPQAELGGILLSQGHFKQGLSYLGKSHNGYRQLKMPERAAIVQKLYQVAQNQVAQNQIAQKEIKDQKVEVSA